MPGKNLTRAEAEERAALVDVLSYAVSLDLTTSEETFRSRTRIEFSATRPRMHPRTMGAMGQRKRSKR